MRFKVKYLFGWIVFLFGGLLLFGVAVETVSLISDYFESGHMPDFIMIVGDTKQYPGWYIYIIDLTLGSVGIGITWFGWRSTRNDD